MIAVSDKFKKSLQTNGKMIDAIIIDENNNIYYKENIISIDYAFKGDLCKSLMCEVDVELKGYHDLKGKSFTIQFGVKQNPTDDYEYVPLGKFIVKEQEQRLDTKSTQLECYDFMIQSMIPYDLELSYPITIGNYLKIICERLGWELIESEFVNSTKFIDEEKYNNEYTFRDVLDELAQASGSIIKFTKDNKVSVSYMNETNEIIDYNLRKFSVGNKYGPINSLVLSRTPQEDNIYRRDDESIEKNGLTELKIENNQIMDKNRDDFIDEIFNYINGFEYFPFELESFGYCYLEPADIITFIDPITNLSYKTILLSGNIQISKGLNEIDNSEIFNLTKTDYDKASKTDRDINITKIQVDKQNQVIESVVSSVSDQNEKISTITIKTGTIESTVSTISNETSILESTVKQLQTDSYTKTQIDEKLTDGSVTAVKSTVVTIDSDGQTIDKSDSPVKTNTDADGLSIIDKTGASEEILLEAKYDEAIGETRVRSKNIVVEKYLTIGSHSRVEDYETGTGIFYIG